MGFFFLRSYKICLTEKHPRLDCLTLQESKLSAWLGEGNVSIQTCRFRCILADTHKPCQPRLSVFTRKHRFCAKVH